MWYNNVTCNVCDIITCIVINTTLESVILKSYINQKNDINKKRHK
jgi:hypothetical protein